VRVFDVTLAAAFNTCSVANIAPPLTPVRVIDLPANNATATANAAFTMPLTCTGAEHSVYQTPLRFTLRDANSTGNSTNQLTPVAAGTTSSGVRLQLLRKDSSGAYVVQNLNSTWNLDVYPSTRSVPIEFAVRYLRVGALIPGTIRSQATLTLDYR